MATLSFLASFRPRLLLTWHSGTLTTEAGSGDIYNFEGCIRRGGFSSSKSDMMLCSSMLLRSKVLKNSSSDKLRFSSLLKNFWAWDLACVEVRVFTCSWTFFHSLLNSFRAAKNLKCSSFVHLPFLKIPFCFGLLLDDVVLLWELTWTEEFSLSFLNSFVVFGAI